MAEIYSTHKLRTILLNENSLLERFSINRLGEELR